MMLVGMSYNRGLGPVCTALLCKPQESPKAFQLEHDVAKYVSLNGYSRRTRLEIKRERDKQQRGGYCSYADKGPGHLN